MRFIELEVPAIDKTVQRILSGSGPQEVSRDDRSLLSEFRVHRWRGATVIGALHSCEGCDGAGLLEGEQCDECLGEGEVIVTLLAVMYGKRPQATWGPYATVYGVFTDPCYRHRGYMRALFAYTLVIAQAQGCNRVKGFISSEPGLRLVSKMGLRTWGQNRRGQVVLDAPLGIEHPSHLGKIPPTVVL